MSHDAPTNRQSWYARHAVISSAFNIGKMSANSPDPTDTLDLQDKSSPTAADHSQNPHPAPLGIGPAAPHQEASLRRVDDERSDEQTALQNGWNAANGSRSDGDADQASRDDEEGDSSAVRLNGGMSGEGDDAEMDDAEVDEDDLDDLDRISSSPSISDGGCFLPSYSTWSERRNSPPPRSTPISSPVESAQECDSSSPYVDTPLHFPLAAPSARRPPGVPAGGAVAHFSHCETSSPIPLQSSQRNPPSTDHHLGEYIRPRTTSGPTNNAPDSDCSLSPQTKFMTAVERRLQGTRLVYDTQLDSEISLMSELDEEGVQAMLKPVPSPLPEISDDSSLDESMDSATVGANNGVINEVSDSSLSGNGSSSDDNDSWVTDSDADSCDDGLDRDDDDSNDIFFSTDPRYVDSGWEGICLRDTEDIDFDFVYALHTFVATVEGQVIIHDLMASRAEFADMVRRMLRKVTRWFCSTTATATGGS